MVYDWYRNWHTGLGLALDWQIDLGLTCWSRIGRVAEGICLERHLIANGLSESSSVETLRSVPYSSCSFK